MKINIIKINNASLALAFLLTSQLFGQDYSVVDSKSSVKFTIKNFGSDVDGTDKGLAGNIKFDPKNLAIASFKVSADAGSINTNNSVRDKDIKAEKYFHVAKFPKITFVSTKVVSNGNDNYTITGNLTIKGTTKQITFPFKAIPQNGGYLFQGQVKINRRDFKVGTSSLVLSDFLILKLSIFGQKTV